MKTFKLHLEINVNDLSLSPGPDPLLLVDDDGDHLLGVQVERFSLSCVFTSTERLNMAPRVMKSDEEVGVNTGIIFILLCEMK